MKEKAPVQERILTPEEEEVVRQLSEAQAQLQESIEELQNGTGLSEEALEKLRYKVSNAIAIVLGIASWIGIHVMTGSGYGGSGSTATAMEFVASAGTIAAIVTPILAASYTIETLIKRTHPLKIMQEQGDTSVLRKQLEDHIGEYERQVSLSRGIVTNALVRGGATLKYGGIHDATLSVTPEQIEMARKEAESDGVDIVRPEDVK
jgi:exonuclease VII small subunit